MFGRHAMKVAEPRLLPAVSQTLDHHIKGFALLPKIHMHKNDPITQPTKQFIMSYDWNNNNDDNNSTVVKSFSNNRLYEI